MLLKLNVTSQTLPKLSRYAKISTMTKFHSRTAVILIASTCSDLMQRRFVRDGRACHHSTVTSAISDVSDHRPLFIVPVQSANQAINK